MFQSMVTEVVQETKYQVRSFKCVLHGLVVAYIVCAHIPSFKISELVTLSCKGGGHTCPPRKRTDLRVSWQPAIVVLNIADLVLPETLGTEIASVSNKHLALLT